MDKIGFSAISGTAFLRSGYKAAFHMPNDNAAVSVFRENDVTFLKGISADCITKVEKKIHCLPQDTDVFLTTKAAVVEELEKNGKLPIDRFVVTKATNASTIDVTGINNTSGINPIVIHKIDRAKANITNSVAVIDEATNKATLTITDSTSDDFLSNVVIHNASDISLNVKNSSVRVKQALDVKLNGTSVSSCDFFIHPEKRAKRK